VTAAGDARPSNRWLYAATAALVALSMGVQAVRDRGWAPYEPPNPVLWLRSGPLAKRLALGFDNLVSDVYWMRAVVYYGGTRLGTMDPVRRNYGLLYPLLDLVTTLDPHFKVAYRFGAIFLTEAYPQGPGRPDQAVQLLERAVQADPRHAWEYMQDIGFVYYWWLRDYAAAAAWFDRSSQQPGAPAWMRPLAATTLARGGDRASSRFLWTQILQGTDVDWLRRNAQLRLAQLDAMDALDALNVIAERFARRTGRPARSWPELVAGERLRGVPADPSGTPYEIDPATGAIVLSRQSSLWPLPTDTPAPGEPPK
jgi:hypothetical protein